MDPSPFRQRDLDPDAEDFIVGWARELPPNVALALVVHLDRPAGLPEEPGILRDAIREFFSQRALASRRRLRELFRRERTSLAIAVNVPQSGLRGFSAVAPRLFRTIQRVIGSPHEAVDLEVLWFLRVVRRDAHGHGHGQVIIAKRVGHPREQPFG
jgi:hypothetical protein